MGRTHKGSELTRRDKRRCGHGHSKLRICQNQGLLASLIGKVTYVVQPVGLSAKADSLGADAKREHLADNNPRNGAPREAKAYRVYPDEDNRYPAGSPVRLPIIAERARDASYDEVGRGHADTAGDKNGLPAEAIDIKDSRDCGQEHYHADNTRRKQRRRGTAEAQPLENERGVVENRIHLWSCELKPVRINRTRRTYAIPLLENHGEDSYCSPLDEILVGKERHVIVVRGHEVALEAAVLVLRELLHHSHPLKVAHGLDLEELDAHANVVRRGAAQARQRVQALLLAVAVHQVARALRHEEHHARGQDGRRQELDTDGDQPGGVRLALSRASDEVRSVADPCSRRVQVIKTVASPSRYGRGSGRIE